MNLNKIDYWTFFFYTNTQFFISWSNSNRNEVWLEKKVTNPAFNSGHPENFRI